MTEDFINNYYEFTDTPKGYDVSVISVYGKYILIMPVIPVFYKYCLPMQYNHFKNFAKLYMPNFIVPDKVTDLIVYEVPNKALSDKLNLSVGRALLQNFKSYGKQIFKQNTINEIGTKALWAGLDAALKTYGRTYAEFASEWKPR